MVSALFVLGMLVAFGCMVVGLFSPSKVMPKAKDKVWTRKDAARAYVSLTVIFLIAAVVAAPSKESAQPPQVTASVAPAPASTQPAAGEPDDGWRRASGRIWSGVKLYYGPNKMPVGEVMGGNDDYVSPTGLRFRGVKVKMASGSAEWKDREAIVSGQWFVRADDPAIDRMEWFVFGR